MGVREKISERMRPLLEPDEQIQVVFMCQTGPPPWLGVLSALITLFGGKYYVVAVTDRAIVVARASAWWPAKPKHLEQRLPRATTIGPISGLWGQSSLVGRTTYIHRRFKDDIERADSLAGAAPAPAAPAAPAAAGPVAGWYEDPSDATRIRYFDGTAWTEQTAPR